MLKKCVVIIPIYHPDSKFNQLLIKLGKQKDVSFDVYITQTSQVLSTRKAL